MFGNLVESSSHKGDYARRSSFFLATLVAYALVFLAIGVGSIYAYNTHIETQNLELVALVAPVETPETPTPEIRVAPRPSAGGNTTNTAVVKTPPVIVTMDPRNAPKEVSISTDVVELPQMTVYRIGNPGPGDNIFGNPGKATGDRPGSGNGNGSKEINDLVKIDPPPVMERKVTKPPAPKTISLGVVNGKASHLPRPVYSAIAKAAHAYGIVTVQVLIDESGKVISAQAISGPPLLQRESVQAAYQARFTPTLLSNQPVKVSGVITYNFTLQ